MKSQMFLVFTGLVAMAFSGGPYGMDNLYGDLSKRSSAFAVDPYATGSFAGSLSKREEGMIKRAPLGSRSSADFLNSLLSVGDSMYGLDDPYMDRAWGAPQKRRAGSKAYAQWISSMKKGSTK